MSLYNALFGMNADLAVILSGIVGYRIDEDFPRFRNVFTDVDDAPKHLKGADFYVYTRMGGGNRECWGSTEQEGAPADVQFDCLCSACKADRLEARDGCIGSYDDSYDCTYRSFAMKFTEKQREEFEAAQTEGGISDELWERILDLYPKLRAKYDATKAAAEAEAPTEEAASHD